MKENKQKRSTRIWWSLFLTILVIYTSVFIMVNFGYYEYAAHQRTFLTEEQIKQFEEDVRNGVEIDLKDYFIPDELRDPTKKRIGLRLSEGIGSVSKRAIGGMFNFLNKLIEE